MGDGEQVQPTTISKEEYIKFKQWVQDTHGTTRGHLSTEIENALREYRQPDNSYDALARIEDDVATIKAAVAHAESDGGTHLTAEDTRPRENTNNSGSNTNKPKPNAPRSKKVEFFVTKYYSREGGRITVGSLKKLIKNEFGFQSGVIDEYVDLVVAELDAKRHPDKAGTFV